MKYFSNSFVFFFSLHRENAAFSVFIYVLNNCNISRQISLAREKACCDKNKWVLLRAHCKLFTTLFLNQKVPVCCFKQMFEIKNKQIKQKMKMRDSLALHPLSFGKNNNVCPSSLSRV